MQASVVNCESSCDVYINIHYLPTRQIKQSNTSTVIIKDNLYFNNDYIFKFYMTLYLLVITVGASIQQLQIHITVPEMVC